MKYFYYNENLELEKVSDRDLQDNNYIKVIFDSDEPQNTNEFKLKVLRAKRDKILKEQEKDTQLKFLTMKNPDPIKYSALQDYWQILRDLPTTADVSSVSISQLNSLFPVKPE